MTVISIHDRPLAEPTYGNSATGSSRLHTERGSRNADGDGRLVLVSNRLPLTISRVEGRASIESSVGGLVAALRKPHAGSRGLWIGWSGECPERQSEVDEVDALFGKSGMVPVHLSRTEIRRYYGDFANGVLWPLFHYATGLVPMEARGWEEYVAVNERFADAIASRASEADLIWIHDYQLMLLPLLVRQRLPRARIGFFLHIPFPAPEVFAMLPCRERLLEGLLGADLIGFHTAPYRRHFEGSIRQYLAIPSAGGTLTYGERRVHLGVFPVGVDAARLSAEATRPALHDRVRNLRGDGSQRILLGIDRLDYTKGIPRRLLAYRELLRRRPEWRGKVRLVQVAVPSRGELQSYRKLSREVDGLIGKINGEFGTADWVPIHYLRHSIPADEISALYRAADVMLVTPIRDGMNLVAKEFVATRADGDGVLVLSEFAGAAAELRDAIPVNPYDVEGTAECYHRALTMPESERRARMYTMRESVSRYDVDRWVQNFLGELSACTAIRGRAAAC